MDIKEGKGVCGMNWEIGIYIYIYICHIYTFYVIYMSIIYFYIYNKQFMRTYCIVQGTLLNALW